MLQKILIFAAGAALGAIGAAYFTGVKHGYSQCRAEEGLATEPDSSTVEETLENAEAATV